MAPPSLLSTDLHQFPDASTILDEWVNRVSNLPPEIAFMQAEIAHKDTALQACVAIIARSDAQIQKWVKVNGAHVPNPKEKTLLETVRSNYDSALKLQAEKVTLAVKTQAALDKHTRWLDGHIKALQERGEFPDDGETPSLLQPQATNDGSAGMNGRKDSSSVNVPAGQIGNSGGSAANTPEGSQRQSSTIRASGSQAAGSATGSISGGAGTSAAASSSASAAALLLQRGTREGSIPSSKRARLSTSLGHLPPSGLARHSSLTPGTPRASTPGASGSGARGGRAGSTGAGPSRKTIGNKKMSTSAGSGRTGSQNKTHRISKSSLGRLKRAGGRGSPASTADSDASDGGGSAASGGDEDEDTQSQHAGHGTNSGSRNVDMHNDDDGNGDEADAEADDRKYCMCQSVSYGDMVACDGESCPYEWFHWSCVGLKSEPVGIWICPICSRGLKKNAAAAAASARGTSSASVGIPLASVSVPSSAATTAALKASTSAGGSGNPSTPGSGRPSERTSGGNDDAAS